MKVLWRSDAISNPVGQEVRITDLDGDVIFEMTVVDSLGFRDRLKNCIMYLFKKRPFAVSFVLLDEQFKDMCRKVIENGR